MERFNKLYITFIFSWADRIDFLKKTTVPKLPILFLIEIMVFLCQTCNICSYSSWHL